MGHTGQVGRVERHHPGSDKRKGRHGYGAHQNHQTPESGGRLWRALHGDCK